MLATYPMSHPNTDHKPSVKIKDEMGYSGSLASGGVLSPTTRVWVIHLV
jgi:hypothetical protein